MPFLSVAGITVPVAIDGANENEVFRLGTSLRAYAGNLRSTVRGEKRTWVFKTTPQAFAAMATIRAAIANAAQVACTGDFNNGVSVTCEVTLSQTGFLSASSGSDALNHMRVLTLTLVEV